jgi:hypothetical protein
MATDFALKFEKWLDSRTLDVFFHYYFFIAFYYDQWELPFMCNFKPPSAYLGHMFVRNLKLVLILAMSLCELFHMKLQ